MWGSSHRLSCVAALLIVVAFLLSSCGGCPRRSSEQEGAVEESPTGKAAKREYASPRAREFLSQFENLFKEQEETRERDEGEAQRAAEQAMVRNAVDETIDELMALDPVKDAARAEMLIGDLKDLGEPARKALQVMLAEDRPKPQRILLTKALGAFTGEEVSEALYQKAVQERDREVRETALASLAGRPAGERAIDKLYAVVRTSGDPEEQKKALRDIGAIGGEESQALLNDVMQSDEELRPTAAEALGGMKKEDVVLQFGEILIDGDSEESLRIAAVKGLGQDNGELARTILLNVLKDTRQPRSVHKEAIGALLAGAGEGGPNEVMQHIALFETTPVEYLPQLLQPLIAKGEDIAAEYLNDRYQRFNRLKKVHAIRTWGRMKGDRVYHILSERLADEKDPGIRREIESAMKQVKGDRS